MKKYKFCTYVNEEAIAQCESNSFESASQYFADMKKLSVEEFLKIYRVLEA